ncbi:Crp/Fnr family transcriptional regulator [Candidatus Gracilibacteria bacterium]|nr:Crp/Fnr family transcriptional regulator [Candidatus Gracilibacteria bacterium]
MTEGTKTWYLQQIDLFEGIPDEEIMRIAEKMEERRCTKKELIYTPFEANDSVCVLKKGEVTLYYSHNGKKLIIDVLKPGSIFGNIAFNDKNSDHFAEVTEDAYICFFSVEDFMKIIQAKPELMMRFLKIMSERISDYEKRIKSGLFDAKEKIIQHLEIIKEKGNKGILTKLIGGKKRITHERLAQFTGLSRETVTRAINDLKKEGRIVDCEETGICLSH